MKDSPTFKHSLGGRLQKAAESKFGPVKTQAKLVAASGISQSVVGKIWRGDVKESVYTPKLADVCEVRSIWLHSAEGPMHAEAGLDSITHLQVSDQDKIGILYFEDLMLNGGVVTVPPNTASKKKYLVSKKTISDLKLNPNECFIATVVGDSMAHILSHGSIVLVDMSDTNWRVSTPKVFALNHSGQCVLRLVCQTLNGGMRVSSENSDKNRYPDETYSSIQAQDVEILGRVRWFSGVFD